MSVVVEGPSSVAWKGVQLPGKGAVWTFSPTFRIGNEEWKLKCGTYEPFIYLRLYRYSGPSQPDSRFSVSVRVEGDNDERRGLEDQKKDLTLLHRCWSGIWIRPTEDVKRILPEFGSERRLAFRVTIEVEDTDRPLTACSYCGGATLAAAQPSPSPCPRPELHTRAFSSASVQTYLSSQSSRPSVEASVQTSHSTIPCACLESLSEDFAKMMVSEDCSPDVEIRCDGYTTGAHKSVLCSRSQVLAKMLQSDMKEGLTGIVDIQDMETDTFKQFLRHLYTGRVDDTLTFESVLRLYEVGDLYAVHSLRRHCSDLLIANLTIDNACDALVVADTHSDPEFVEVVIAFILEKEIPQSSDQWPDFCDRNPVLALKVANKIFRRR